MKIKIFLLFFGTIIFISGMHPHYIGALDKKSSQVETLTIQLEMRSFYYTAYNENGTLIANLTSPTDTLTLYSSKTTKYIFNISNIYNGPLSNAHSVLFNIYYESPMIEVGNYSLSPAIGFDVGTFTVACSYIFCGPGHDTMKFKMNIVDKPITHISTSTSGSYIYIFYNVTNISYSYVSVVSYSYITQISYKTVETVVYVTKYNVTTLEKSVILIQKLSGFEFLPFLVFIMVSFLLVFKRRRSER